MRIADMLAARKANKRMMKLTKKLRRAPHDRASAATGQPPQAP